MEKEGKKRGGREGNWKGNHVLEELGMWQMAHRASLTTVKLFERKLYSKELNMPVTIKS